MFTKIYVKQKENMYAIKSTTDMLKRQGNLMSNMIEQLMVEDNNPLLKFKILKEKVKKKDKKKKKKKKTKKNTNDGIESNHEMKDSKTSVGKKIEIPKEEITAQMNGFLKTKLNQKVNDSLIDPRFYKKFDKDQGFYLSIDNVINPYATGPYCIICNILPPGGLFGDTNIDGSHFISCIADFSSPLYNQRFIHEPVILNPKFYGLNSVLIMEVKRIEFSNDTDDFEITSESFTFIPLMVNKDYLNCGVFQLPLISGNLEQGILQKIISLQSWDAFNSFYTDLDKPFVKNSGLEGEKTEFQEKFLPNASVLIRIKPELFSVNILQFILSRVFIQKQAILIESITVYLMG